MKQIKFNTRFFLKTNGRVFMRVRWAAGKCEISLSLQVKADRAKWNIDSQRAIRNTIHEVNGETYSARSINNEIEKALDIVNEFFMKYNLNGLIPPVSEVKNYLTEQLIGSTSIVDENVSKANDTEPSLSTLFASFILNYSQENNWAPKTRYKYDQAFKHLMAYRSTLKLSSINKKLLNEFKIWLIEQEYKNSTVTKYFRCLKTAFRWFREEGYAVSEDIIAYRSKLSVPTKNIIYLKYEEVQKFSQYEFPGNKQYLSRARDMFCFMCFTSLRYSDLKSLKKAAIVDDEIIMHSQKTKSKLKIPLVKQAKLILNRYINDTSGEYVFPVPSAQKLNDFIKEAAEITCLDREVIDTTYCGNRRIEKTLKLHEAISCHDARRTFVCLSLSLGIPESIVMACTGHSDYAAMKPYIAITDESAKREIAKWEIGSVRNELNKTLDAMDEISLRKVIDYAKTLK